MAPKKVLIVTYYWYPFAGVGTYRISRFAKYLAKLGWDIVVLTPQEAVAGMLGKPDDPVLNEVTVYRSQIIEPVSLLKGKNTGSGNTSNPTIFYRKNASLMYKLAVWIRLNLMIPDAKLSWKWFAVPLGKKVIEQEQPDLILSTSPPPTTSRIAEELAKWSGLPWIADFRDPWTNVYYYDDHPQSKPARKINKSMEESVLRNADKLTLVNDGFFPEHRESIAGKSTVIPNGFDPDHVISSPEGDSHGKFSIRYFGSMKINQYPKAFIQALKLINAKNPAMAGHIRFEFFGSIDPNIKEEIEAASGKIEASFQGYIPHEQMMELVNKSDLLLLLIGRTENSKFGLSTKVFEYMTSGRPVLGIGPLDGAAADLVQKTNIGKFFSHEDNEGVYEFITRVFDASKNGKSLFTPSEEAINEYDFSYLTEKLDQIMQSLTGD